MDNGSDSSRIFSVALTLELHQSWLAWIDKWHDALAACPMTMMTTKPCTNVKANPQFGLREWMLMGAYHEAAKAEHTEFLAPYVLTQRP